MTRLLVLLGLVLIVAPASQARIAGGTPVALVTAETLNQLLVVSLPSGRVVRRIRCPRIPRTWRRWATTPPW